MTLGEINLLTSSEKCSVYVIYIGVHSRTLSGYIIFNYLTTSEKPSSQTKQTMFEIHNSVVANVTDALLFILKCHIYRGNSPSLFGNIIRIRI